MSLDRNTPGLDETTRSQLIDQDQDKLIKILQEHEAADDAEFQALVKLLSGMKDRITSLEKTKADKSELPKPISAAPAPEKGWLAKLLGL